MEAEAAKYIGAGLACFGMAGAGSAAGAAAAGAGSCAMAVPTSQVKDPVMNDPGSS